MLQTTLVRIAWQVVLLAAFATTVWTATFTEAQADHCRSVEDDRYEIGVFYYPGWHTTVGRPKAVNSPWDPLYDFPGREPLLGWYRGDDSQVVRQQMQWMCDNAINNVVFDWYFDKDHTRLDAPLRVYLDLHEPKPKFSLLWANHNHATTTEEWDRIVQFWADHYLSDPSFYSIDGRKAVYIFSLQKMAHDAALDGTTLRDWIERAQRTLRRQGKGELYFIGGVKAGDAVISTATGSGIDAFSAYNYQTGPADRVTRRGYASLDFAYRRQWAGLLASGVPLIMPMTTGWDRRPWGGSSDPERDGSMADEAAFREHLTAAKAQMDETGVRRGVICCWNEYGEGSILEPTRQRRLQMIEAVREVFSR